MGSSRDRRFSRRSRANGSPRHWPVTDLAVAPPRPAPPRRPPSSRPTRCRWPTTSSPAGGPAWVGFREGRDLFLSRRGRAPAPSRVPTAKIATVVEGLAARASERGSRPPRRCRRAGRRPTCRCRSHRLVPARRPRSPAPPPRSSDHDAAPCAAGIRHGSRLRRPHFVDASPHEQPRAGRSTPPAQRENSPPETGRRGREPLEHELVGVDDRHVAPVAVQSVRPRPREHPARCVRAKRRLADRGGAVGGQAPRGSTQGLDLGPRHRQLRRRRRPPNAGRRSP